MKLKLVTWNIAWMHQLLRGYTRTSPQSESYKKVTSAEGKAVQLLEKQQIAAEILNINPDILCIQEGPSTGRANLLRDFCDDFLNGIYTLIEREPTDTGGYQVRGSQGIWFLVRTSLLGFLQPQLLPVPAWREATLFEAQKSRYEYDGTGKKWTVRHPWFKDADNFQIDDEGDELVELLDKEHGHYRHPQTLVCTINGKRVDFIGVHLKSKFIARELQEAGALRQKPKSELTKKEKERINRAEEKAVEARIKLTTEAIDIRLYIDNRFRNEPNPAIFLLGDMNDGIGKEYFERSHLFHDLISNLQGDVFFARKFLNHALFDYAVGNNENFRWTAFFEDVWDPSRPPEILLDHIMFSQPCVGNDAIAISGLCVGPGAGQVEHKAHVTANAPLATRGETSDHRPVSVEIDIAAPIF